ncbi:sensor histidine kinase [Pseudobacteriovorax antillogorgiicola]|nr:response regulator [Pseudobacteriovorax antillogorgiicola]
MELKTQGSNENRRIVIVDDEPKNLKILRIRLAKDYELAEASSGEEAQDIIRSFQPALVLLDIMMPGMSGYELTKLIKQDPSLGNPKVILLSGKGLIEEKLEGYESGADDYLTKPFNKQELEAKIRVFLRLFNLEQQLIQINQDLEEEVKLRSEQLLKAERLTFVGLHSAQIVHNLKNPLQVLRFYVDNLKKDHPESKAVTKIDEVQKKLLEIVKNILGSVDRDLKDDIVPLEIDRVLRDELDFLRLGASEQDIRLKVDLDADVMVMASASHIRQVVGNLVKNAMDALWDQDQKSIKVRSEVSGSDIIVSVQDSGPGIPSNLQEKIFEPLFTTKDGNTGQAPGHGLGLSYCRRIIENYGGSLAIKNHEEGGAIATVHLPIKHAGKSIKKAS